LRVPLGKYQIDKTTVVGIDILFFEFPFVMKNLEDNDYQITYLLLAKKKHTNVP
jgi:hypothetical protein